MRTIDLRPLVITGSGICRLIYWIELDQVTHLLRGRSWRNLLRSSSPSLSLPRAWRNKEINRDRGSSYPSHQFDHRLNDVNNVDSLGYPTQIFNPLEIVSSVYTASRNSMNMYTHTRDTLILAASTKHSSLYRRAIELQWKIHLKSVVNIINSSQEYISSCLFISFFSLSPFLLLYLDMRRRTLCIIKQTIHIIRSTMRASSSLTKAKRDRATRKSSDY